MKGQIKPRWKPGESGNPAGRPKEPPALKATLAAVLAAEVKGETTLETILRAMVARAVKGDVRAAQELLDRAYGKARQSIEHSGGAAIFAPIVRVSNQNEADLLRKIKEDAELEDAGIRRWGPVVMDQETADEINRITED